MNITKKAGLAVGMSAAAVLAIAPAAFAANVLKVDGLTTVADVPVSGPLVTGTTIGFKTDYNVPATCSASAAGGYVKRGVTVGLGTKIGAITSLTFSSCTATTLGFPVTIAKKGATEWGIFATAAPTSKTQATIPVEIRGVVAQMRSTGATPLTCELEATGTVAGTFNQNTQVLAITPATTTTYTLPIVAHNGAGTKTPQPSGVGTCGGQIYTGDRAQMTGSFQLSTGVVGGGGIHLQ